MLSQENKMRPSMLRLWVLCLLLFLLTSCGFHLRGETQLAPPLHRLYLQTADPYGYLSRYLQQNLKMSHVQLVSSPAEAETVLVIMKDENSQELLSVSGTQQTRQFNLRVTVVFSITTPQGLTLLSPQTLVENRIMTIQLNQILGSSNEVNLFYQQMRQSIANAMMTRIASQEVSEAVTQNLPSSSHRKP
jgi:LPS-assembly lipoprotein